MEQDALRIELIEVVGGRHVLEGDDRTRYLIDQRGRNRGRAAFIVRPGTTSEVALVVGVCRRHRTPIVPIGGNTGLAGGAATADPRAVVLSLERICAIREVDRANRHVVVEAGVTVAAVQGAARDIGLDFPVRFGAEATAQIGGALSTNVGGTNVIRHGSIRHRVLGIEAVLPDGRIVRDLRGLRKDNAGYAWAQLLVGAEGTLGVITAACLSLTPPVPHRAVALVGVATMADAVELLGLGLDCTGDRIEAFEVVDAPACDLVAEWLPAVTAGLASLGPVTVLIEVGTIEKDAAEPALNGLIEAGMASGLVIDSAVAFDESARRRLWRLREAVPEAERLAGPSIKHDISTRTSGVAELASAVARAVSDVDPGARLVVFGHVGDGNLHANVLSATVDGSEISDAVHRAVASLGGSISAEHGIGRDRREPWARYGDPVAIDLMRTLKRTLDPDGLMNPGALWLPDDGAS